MRNIGDVNAEHWGRSPFRKVAFYMDEMMI